MTGYSRVCTNALDSLCGTTDDGAAFSTLPGMPLPFAIQCETVYHGDVIRSFRSKDTEKLFRREQTRKYAGFENVAKRKLDHLNAVASLSDLAAIPGNHFEPLSGDRLGQYSIRINDRWRICFEWKNPDAYSVEIVDYH